MKINCVKVIHFIHLEPMCTFEISKVNEVFFSSLQLVETLKAIVFVFKSLFSSHQCVNVSNLLCLTGKFLKNWIISYNLLYA